jgi:hypothetical protein
VGRRVVVDVVGRRVVVGLHDMAPDVPFSVLGRICI